jgi:hypothetical protein
LSIGRRSPTSKRAFQKSTPILRVDALRLPAVWLRLGRRYCSSRYFLRAAEAAEAINDRILARFARHEAEEAGK